MKNVHVRMILLALVFSFILMGGGCDDSATSKSYQPPSIVETPKVNAAPLVPSADIPTNKKSNPVPSQEKKSCCKVCSKGKACGDSCISRSYTCHKAPGCACDAE